MVWILEELPVAEIAPQKTKLPEVVGDVLAYIGHGAVGADNDLRILIGAFVWSVRIVIRLRAVYVWIAVRSRWTGGASGHYPATFVLALGLQVENAFFLQLPEGQIPEMQVQNFALARQQIVLDAQPQHGFKVPPQNGSGDQLADLGRLVAAGLDSMQSIETQHLARGGLRRIGAVPLRNARIEIPAVVVDPLARLGQPRHQLPDSGQRKPLQMHQSDHDIRHLDARVVDVVLHVDLLSGGAQQAHEGVAEDSVAQMANVGGLVGIDSGVLDQSVQMLLRKRHIVANGIGAHERGAVQARVDVPGAG